MKPQIYDISPLISSRLGVFPGDQSFSRQVAFKMDDGHNFELSKVLTTLHLGAHADAPSHYARSANSIDQVSLAPYIGQAQVVHIRGLRPKERLGKNHFQTSFLAPRLLIGTNSFPDPEHWNSDFCGFAPDFLQTAYENGVRLIGIDTPSVDLEDDRDLQAHQILAKNKMSVLEGLMLNHVPEGIYTLIALPLKMEGADASPVRAILIASAQEFPEFLGSV